jgi:GNAT superfamily N-acetyltransferase
MLPDWIKGHPSYAHYPVDVEHTKRMAEGIDSVLHGRLLLDDESNIVGALLYIVAPTFYSPAIEANELVFYIQPEHRSYKAARKLVQSAEQDAFDLGAVRFIMGNSGGHRDKSIEKLYTRLGFYSASGTYYKER